MIKKLTFQPISRFSLFTKVPKKISQQQSSSWLKGLFQKTKKSPSYPLLKQLFQYLKSTPILVNEFPFLQNDQKFQQNWMIIHTILLKNRLRAEQSFNARQLQVYNYNCQAYCFPQFAQKIHTHIPTKDFVQHFTQAYIKKFEIFEKVVQQQQKQLSLIKSQQLLVRYSYLFRKLIYQSRVQEKDYQLHKFSKYYLAHRKYLFMLSYQDMLQFQIKWGFQGDIKLIQNYK